jgi:hypothetical protein
MYVCDVNKEPDPGEDAKRRIKGVSQALSL